MALNIKGFEFNMFGEITYVVWDESSHEAAVVDAGMCNSNERMVLDDFIATNELKIKYLVNTHIHIDHVFGVPYMKERYNVGLSASLSDEFLGDRIEQQAKMFHLPVEVSNVVIEHPLEAGDELKLGDEIIMVIDVPGHTPGGLALYAPESRFVITGDSLFNGSIGRTDLPGGDYATLVKAVSERLLTLPGDTTVYPGHGPSTTIAREKAYNPYL